MGGLPSATWPDTPRPKPGARRHLSGCPVSAGSSSGAAGPPRTPSPQVSRGLHAGHAHPSAPLFQVPRAGRGCFKGWRREKRDPPRCQGPIEKKGGDGGGAGAGTPASLVLSRRGLCGGVASNFSPEVPGKLSGERRAAECVGGGAEGERVGWEEGRDSLVAARTPRALTALGRVNRPGATRAVRR